MIRFIQDMQLYNKQAAKANAAHRMNLKARIESQ